MVSHIHSIFKLSASGTQQQSTYLLTLKLRVLARLIYKLMLAFSEWGTLMFIYCDLLRNCVSIL